MKNVLPDSKTLVPEARYPNKWENIILVNENSAV